MIDNLRRTFAALALLAVVWQSPADAQEPPTYVTGSQFLAQTAKHQASYISGLADSLIGLQTAQLTGGFLWFVKCAREKTADQLAADFADFLNSNPARKPEPAANNFLWAMGKACKFP